jgi:hypothetical protein
MTPFLLTLLPIKLFLAQTDEYATGGAGPVPPIFGLLITVLLIAAMWKVFTKAGQLGWACLIPIYNIYVLCKVVGRPGWWVILMLIPFVNFIIGIILCIDLARCFGNGVGFGLGLAFLGIIFSRFLALAVPNTNALSRERSSNSALHRPIRLALLVKSTNAFTRFG